MSRAGEPALFADLALQTRAAATAPIARGTNLESARVANRVSLNRQGSKVTRAPLSPTARAPEA